MRIALVGDFKPDVAAHQAIPEGAGTCRRRRCSAGVAGHRIRPATPLDVYAGFWCVPASPYRSMEGALRVIRFARENRRPFPRHLRWMPACCSGIRAQCFGHLSCRPQGERPATSEPVITNLACALIESSEILRPVPGTRLHQIYGADEIRETYHCSYGLNPDYIPRLEQGGLRIGVLGPNGEPRAVELPNHPFFTLGRCSNRNVRHSTAKRMHSFAPLWLLPMRSANEVS